MTSGVPGSRDVVPTKGVLGLDEDSLISCVACGLCLPHCPTYRATGDERRSPRGRIALMRDAESGEYTLDNEWFESMETCIQCLGCESACPAGVPFGELMGGTRAAMADLRPPPIRLRAGLWILTRPRLLRLGSRLLAVMQRLHLVPRSGFLPDRLPLHGSRLPHPSDGDVVLFTGCVMDAWQPEVHDAVQEVLEAAGSTVVRSGRAAGCCGALHEHAGLHEDAGRLAERVMSALPTSLPVLVDSAGCGAALKAYGRMLGTPEAEVFSARVLDVHEWLADRLDFLPPADPEERGHVIVQDPCHLRHVQRAHTSVHRVLAHCADVVELDDDGLCCGAGGSFSMLQPDLASAARERKVSAIARASERSGATMVVSANPGCSMHLAAAGIEVRHPLELVAEHIRQSATREEA